MAHKSSVDPAAPANPAEDSERETPSESYVKELRPRRVAKIPAAVPRLGVLSLSDEELPAAHRLVQALFEAGVDTFFGVPGGPVSPVFDALLQVKGARLIESRHETSAAFAAADYYRASGRTPAVVVTAGPGATNVVTGVVSAHLERVPMLVICGDVAWAAGGGRLLQDSGPEGIAVEKLLANVTRATARVGQAKTAMAQGLAALSAARNPAHPGPALLVVPIQFGRAPVGATTVAIAAADVQVRPSPEVVEKTARWLVSAARPLLVIGAGCREHAPAIRKLVDTLNVPFVTTPQAKGLVSELHPRSLRHGGLAASMWARAYTAGRVDVALVLGTDLDDCAVGPTRYIGEGGKLIHVDLNAAIFGRNLPTELGIVADVGAFAEELSAVVKRAGLRHLKASTMVRDLRKKSPFEKAEFETDASPRITPQRAIADLEASAGPKAAFITDIGEHMLFALHYLTAREPESFTIHLGLGSMGSGMEVIVALKYRLPIVFAVFNDARYNMVYHGYRQVFGREAGWDSPWTDFAAWARSMGLAGIRVNHPGEITFESLQRLRQAGLPVVLDIRIDREVRVAGGGRNESLQHMSMDPAAG